MPLRLFALDPADIQFILQSMGINDFFALSLCSEETKKIAKATNVKCVQFDSKMFNDHLTACATIEETPDTSVDFNVTLRQPGCVEIKKEGRDVQIWRKEGYSQDDFVAHFMYILSQDRIGRLHMSQLSSWELAEKIGRVVGHCNSLNFDQTVPITFVKRAMTLFNSLETVIKSTPFELSEVLSLNATSVRLMTEFRNSFIVKWEDLVHCNVKHLTIFHVDISEKNDQSIHEIVDEKLQSVLSAYYHQVAFKEPNQGRGNFPKTQTRERQWNSDMHTDSSRREKAQSHRLSSPSQSGNCIEVLTTPTNSSRHPYEVNPFSKRGS